MYDKEQLYNQLNAFNAKGHLRAAIVNFERNKEWLQTVPHEKVEDLAVFARWEFSQPGSGGMVSAKVTDALLTHLQLTKEEAFQMAKANVIKNMSLQPMDDMMAEIKKNGFSVDEEMQTEVVDKMEHSPLYILTNKDGIEGAVLIACPKALEKAREELGEDFYILPSSIHEALLLPKSESPGVEELCDMVRDINRDEVLPEERLSDQVYV